MSFLFYFILLGLLLFVSSDRTKAASQQNQRSYGGFSKKQLFESETEERRKKERERDRQAHGNGSSARFGLELVEMALL